MIWAEPAIKDDKTEVSTDDINWAVRTTMQKLKDKPDKFNINIAMAEARRDLLIELQLWPKDEKGHYV